MSVLERSLARLDRIDELGVLRGHEGRAARAYFAAFAELLPPPWRFDGRNRMPPRDPINAMLSYGYSVLFHTLHATLLKLRLHPGLGHLHAQVAGRPSLVCDLMEEFRPLVVDAVVLTLARKHALDPDEDFELPDGVNAMCRMQPAAKQLLIARLEARMAAPVASREGEEKISLYRLLRAQAARYARALVPEGVPHTGLTWLGSEHGVAMRRLWMVTYDIGDDRCRRKVEQVLSAFGERVQRSVFECRLTVDEAKFYFARLAGMLNAETDSLRAYPFCAACEPEIGWLGIGERNVDQRVWVL
jgi:CRISPR-associated endonuclease Cas2